MIKKWMIEQPLIIIVAGLIIIFLLIIFMGIRIGQTNKQAIQVIESQPLKEQEETEFRVRRVNLRPQNDDADCLEINHNGLFRKYNCATLDTIDQGYLGFDTVETLFDSLTKDSFEVLETSYFGGDTAYTITIETTQGSKTITVQPGEGELPSEIQELIEEIKEEEEEVFAPTPPPGATPTPTSSPTSPPAPTPPPGATPTPIPTPLPPGTTSEPFSCDMLDPHTKSIVISNISCEP